MDLLDDFDPGAYMTGLRTDVPGTIAHARQLLAAAPADLPAPAESCRKTLSAEVKRLEEGFLKVQVQDAAQLKRPVDVSGDNSWSCVKVRLDPYTWLDPERFPDGVRARELSNKLFPTGLSFTQLEYGAQWSEASWRIKLIEGDSKMEADLRRLCGSVFIDELFYWHKEYGKMVGVVAPGRGAKPVEEPRPNLTALRRKVGQAIVAWQVQLVALHLAGHPGARAALRPTDEYREKLASSGSASRSPAPDPKEDPREDPKDPGKPAADPKPAPTPGPRPGGA